MKVKGGVSQSGGRLNDRGKKKENGAKSQDEWSVIDRYTGDLLIYIIAF